MRRFLIGIFCLGTIVLITSLIFSEEVPQKPLARASSFLGFPQPTTQTDSTPFIKPRFSNNRSQITRIDEEEIAREDTEGAQPLITGIPETQSTSTPLLSAIAPRVKEQEEAVPNESLAQTVFSELARSTTPEPYRVPVGSGGSGEEAAPQKIRGALPSQSNPGVKSTLKKIGGQPRGYAMLYAMHPRARATVEREVQILLDSQLENLYISVLVDGTFTFDEAYLRSVIERLNTDGRTLSLGLYFVSGPTMRRYNANQPPDTAFRTIDPIDFRSLIQYDRSTRDSFQNIVRRSIGFFDLNRSLNNANKNYAIVMLEDNLDLSSYEVMKDLAAGIVQDKATFIRNPCPGCFDGNDDESAGDPLEFHEARDFSRLRPHDGYTLDGTGYRYPDETGDGLPLEELKRMLVISAGQDHRFFGLWRSDRQGLKGATQALLPDDRIYAVATEAQARIDIELLREGLDLEPEATATPVTEENFPLFSNQ